MADQDDAERFPADLFASRRADAFHRLGRGVLVLPAAPILYRSRDIEVPYRPDSELYYLTGATEPGTVAVFSGSEGRYVLFVRERDPDAELWSGERLGPEGAADRFGADETYPLAELETRLPELLQEGDRIHFRLGRADTLERRVVAALDTARKRGPRDGTGPRGTLDPGEILDDMRLVKDAYEIERLRAAARVTIEGHLAGLGAVRPGAGEWVVEAAVDGAFRAAGAAGAGFRTIVGSGPNACVLHHVRNDRTISRGDLVLVDAGAELEMYNGDVTRTVPVDGRFTATQRALYDLVEAAREVACASVKPGATIAEVHIAAVGVLTEGLVELGLLEGRVEDIVEHGGYRKYFPHRTSHWLGLDVHDPADYARDGVSRQLEPGMVFTIEPGLYVPVVADGAAAPFAGMGVRIEDDVLVTESGCENLTASLPTAADELEEMLAGGR